MPLEEGLDQIRAIPVVFDGTRGSLARSVRMMSAVSGGVPPHHLLRHCSAFERKGVKTHPDIYCDCHVSALRRRSRRALARP